MSKFTDRQLVQLYHELAADYKEEIKCARGQRSKVDQNRIKSALLDVVERSLTPVMPLFVEAELSGDYENKLGAQGQLPFSYSLASLNQQDDFDSQLSENPMPTLAELDHWEKEKVRTAARTIIEALQSRDVTLEQQPLVTDGPTVIDLPIRITRTYYVCDCCHGHHLDNTLFTWMVLNDLNKPHAVYSSGVATAPSRWKPSSDTTEHKRNQAQADQANELYVALFIGAAILAGSALYYLYHEAINSMDRLIFNEGWLQAVGSYLSMCASFLSSAMLLGMFAYPPLMALCITAGFSAPAVAAVSVLGLFATFGAGLGCLAYNAIQDCVIAANSQDALEPSDPGRFALTEQDMEKWSDEAKDLLDPVKVKCAIVAIRASMGNDMPVSTVASFWATSEVNQQKKAGLELIRKLRKGEIIQSKISIKFGKNATGPIFDLRRDSEIRDAVNQTPVAEAVTSPNEIGTVVADEVYEYYVIEPSAPPPPNFMI